MPEWTAERQATAFRKAYLQARKVEPGMGGRYVGGFHAVVVATAEAQAEDPERLFTRHLATWLAKMPAKARMAPYAFFAQAWGELADIGPAPVEAPRVNRHERMAELNAKLGLLEGELAHAKFTGDDQRIRQVEHARGTVLAEMRGLRQEQRS